MIRVSNCLGPDQAWSFVGPDVSLNYLPRLSADDERRQMAAKSLNLPIVSST